MVAWTAEKDQQLLKGIFAYCNIKSSNGLCEFLADQIGEGCSAKAVSHRISNIRSSGVAKGTPTKTAGPPTTPKKANPSKASGSRSKAMPKKKQLGSSSSSSSSTTITTTDSDAVNPGFKLAGSKRKLSINDDAESDADSVQCEDDFEPIKRIKAEPIDNDEEFKAVFGDVFAKTQDDEAV